MTSAVRRPLPWGRNPLFLSLAVVLSLTASCGDDDHHTASTPTATAVLGGAETPTPAAASTATPTPTCLEAVPVTPPAGWTVYKAVNYETDPEVYPDTQAAYLSKEIIVPTEACAAELNKVAFKLTFNLPYGTYSSLTTYV